MDHSPYLDIACEEAAVAAASGEPAEGAVLVKQNEVVARGHRRCGELNDPVAVSEMDCIRCAGRRNDQPDLTLYSTRYPDMLSAGTIVQFAIGAVVIGLPPASSPALDLLTEKKVPVTFIPHAGCRALGAETG